MEILLTISLLCFLLFPNVFPLLRQKVFIRYLLISLASILYVVRIKFKEILNSFAKLGHVFPVITVTSLA